MEIKPKVNIGDTVNIVNCDLIQTSYNWSISNLQSRRLGKNVDYLVHDIEVTISMKTGEANYKYLISENKEKPTNYVSGWVSDKNIRLFDSEVLRQVEVI